MWLIYFILLKVHVCTLSIPLHHALPDETKTLRVCRRTPGFGGISRWLTSMRSTRCACIEGWCSGSGVTPAYLLRLLHFQAVLEPQHDIVSNEEDRHLVGLSHLAFCC